MSVFERSSGAWTEKRGSTWALASPAAGLAQSRPCRRVETLHGCGNLYTVPQSSGRELVHFACARLEHSAEPDPVKYGNQCANQCARIAWKRQRSVPKPQPSRALHLKPNPRPPRARRSTPRRSTILRVSSKTRPTARAMLLLDFRLPTSGGRILLPDSWPIMIRSWRPPLGWTTSRPSKKLYHQEGASTRAINMASR